MTIRPLALALLTAAQIAGIASSNAGGTAREPAPFSAMSDGGNIPKWEVLKPAKDANDTRYTLVRDGGKVVLKAEAVKSCPA